MKYGKLKEKARKSLYKNYWILLEGLLILLLLTSVGYLISKITSTPWLYYGLSLIVESLFMLGFIKMIANAAKNRKVKIEQFFSKTDLFFKYLGVTLIVGVIVAVLSLLEAISFKSLVVVVTYQSEINFILSVFLIVFGLILSTAILLTIVYMLIAFSQVLFILNDEPELSARSALSKSFDMMEDYVIDYFLLNLSFIGWIILGIFTFGILYLWLIPYMLVTMAHFYEHIKKDYKKTKGNKKTEEIPNDEAQKENDEK